MDPRARKRIVRYLDRQLLLAAPTELQSIVDSEHEVGVARYSDEVVYLVSAKNQQRAAGDVRNARA
jgi:hypothetical protein